MVQENEITMLVIGVSVFVLVLLNMKQVKRFPAWPRLMTAFGFALLAWICTVLEGFLFPDLMNLTEHLSYAISSLFLVLWSGSYTCFLKGKGGG